MRAGALVREFKTTPVGRHVRCRVDSTGVKLENAKTDAPLRHCSFADVRSGRFSEIALYYNYRLSDMRSRRLVLCGVHDSFVLMQNGGLFKPNAKLQLRPFYESLAATLRGLEAVHPDVQIRIGMMSALRWLFFLMGCIMILMGAFALVGFLAMLLTGELNEDSFVVGGIGLGIGFYGISLAVSGNPFRKREYLTPGELARQIEARLANSAAA